MKNGLSLLEQILDRKEISNASLRMLIEEITITDVCGKLRVAVTMKAAFRHHLDLLENGEITERFFDLAAESIEED